MCCRGSPRKASTRRSRTSTSRSKSCATTAATSCARSRKPRADSGLARPIACALDRALPFAEPRLRGLARKSGVESALARPERGDLALVLPEPDREPGEIGGAERGRLGDARAHDGHAEEIRLHLHEEVARRGAPVHAKLGQRDRA